MDVNDVMHQKRVQKILGILKKSFELSLAVRRRRVTFASSQWPCGGCHACWWWWWCGGRWKSQNRKNVYLSPYVKKPLNSKVIKSFVPELRSHQVFFVFWDSYVMNILCTFHTYSCMGMLDHRPPKKVPMYDTKLYLVVRPKFCSS